MKLIMKQRKLVVISLDSLGYLDIKNHLDEAPHLKKLVENGTWVQKVRGVYPTLTYPTHTSIVTGQYPKVHGVINNTRFQPERESEDWCWYRKYVKTPTLYDLAHQAGMKTAAFLWPVTAKAKIDDNIAEIFANRWWKNQVLVSLFNSTPSLIIELNNKYKSLRHGIKQPWLDDFTTACVVDTIKNKRPDLCLVHLVDMDDMRHHYGVNSKQTSEAFVRLDKRVAAIMAASQAAGDFEETDFVIVGDHYQINVDHVIHLNMLFAKKKWLKPFAGKHTFKKDWQVAAHSADGACYVYARKNVDVEKLRQELLQVEGIENVYSQKQASEFGADPNCLLMLEAKKGYYFDNLVNCSQIVEKETQTKGNHGFSPNKKDYFTTAIFCGQDINEGKIISEARIVDEAPTLAKILGLSFPEKIAGQIITDVFKDEG